jgi:hypothetical protein
MQGYHTHSVTTPIERASILRCTMLRAAGQAAVRALGVQTVPPDVFYNPTRLLWLGHDLATGIATFVTEGWDDRPVDEFFARLVSKRVDPILVFNVLAFAQRTVRNVTSAVSNANVTGAVERAAEVVSPRAASLLHETFDMVRNVGESPDFPLTNTERLRASAAMAAAPMARLAYQLSKSKMKSTSQRRHLLKTYEDVVDFTKEPFVKEPLSKEPLSKKPLSKEPLSKNHEFVLLKEDETVKKTTEKTGKTKAEKTGKTKAEKTGMTKAEKTGMTTAKTTETSEMSKITHNLTFGAKGLVRAAGDGVGACTTGEIIIETLNDVWGIVRDHYSTPDGFPRTACLFERHLVDDTRVCRAGQPARHGAFDVGSIRFEESEFKLPREVRMFIWPPVLLDFVETVVGRTARAIGRFDERETRDFVSSFTTCDWKTVTCSKPKRYSVEMGFVATQTLCLGTPFVAAVLGFNVAVVTGMMATGQILSVPIFLYLVYDLSPFCFPAVPTCVFDDVFEFFDDWTPRYIQWPSGVVKHPWYRSATLKRLMPGSEVLDCKAREYRGPFDTFAWVLRRMGWKLPEVVRDMFSALALAEDRRERHAGEDGWCAAISTGPYAVATTTGLVYVVSACVLPAVLFLTSLVPIAGKMFRWVGKMLYELR